MRQLHVQVRPERTERVLRLAAEHDAFSPTAVAAERPGGEEWRMIFLNLPNDRVGPFVDAVRAEVADAQFVLFPYGTLPIQTPVAEVRHRLRDVAPRSTLELVLAALQSLGSWQGLVLYALFSGVVAAFGLIVNASYVLVAAMLIAPMGAPVMVATIGTAIGDRRMAGRGLLRFFVAVSILVAGAVALGWAYGLSASTAMMEEVTGLSAWTALVALVAGAAGAQSQVQSERTSLVTATATGFLIAASLSPAAAVLGLAVPLGRWDYVGLMAFQLALQFAALVTGGWLVLLLYGVRPRDPSTGRGSARGRTLLAAAAAVVLVALVAWQVRQGPRFAKADAAGDVATLARDAVAEVRGARLIDASARFTGPDVASHTEEEVLVSVVVERAAGASADGLGDAVRTAVHRRISERQPDIVPFVDVTVLPGPEAP